MKMMNARPATAVLRRRNFLMNWTVGFWAFGSSSAATVPAVACLVSAQLASYSYLTRGLMTAYRTSASRLITMYSKEKNRMSACTTS